MPVWLAVIDIVCELVILCSLGHTVTYPTELYKGGLGALCSKFEIV